VPVNGSCHKPLLTTRPGLERSHSGDSARGLVATAPGKFQLRQAGPPLELR